MKKKRHVLSQQEKPQQKKKKSTIVKKTIEEAKEWLLQHPLKTPLHDDNDSDDNIDFSDIPELTDAQLKKMKRVGPGRPPFGDKARKLISIKLDESLLENLKHEAEQHGKGYQSLIHEILQNHFTKFTKKRASS